MAQSRAKPPGLRQSAVTLWRSLVTYVSDPYRPELHYMRGPGPKWHAKHAQPHAAAPDIQMDGSLRTA